MVTVDNYNSKTAAPMVRYWYSNLSGAS